MTRISLRKAALAAGEKFFEDHRGCKHGHTLFYSSNGSCVMCPAYRRRPSFASWAKQHEMTPHERYLAELAWKAATGALPTTQDDILDIVRKIPSTTHQIASELGLTQRHAGRILRVLETEGLVSTRGRDGRSNIWSIK